MGRLSGSSTVPQDCEDRAVADERRGWKRIRVVLPLLPAAFVGAQLTAAMTSLVNGNPWDWGWFGSFCVLMLLSNGVARWGAGGVLPTTPEAQRRAAEAAETAQAMRAGLLPPDADPEQWRARIRRERRRAHVIVTYTAGLCIAAAVLTAVAAHLDNGDDPVLWTLAVVALLLLAPPLWLLARSRSRTQRLLRRL
ncbi:MAG: hypothetical protein JWL97_4411 [Gemmatimonadales bacterium]|nr:hypothetical protein [Gemmatimonadales bacterium]